MNLSSPVLWLCETLVSQSITVNHLMIDVALQRD